MCEKKYTPDARIIVLDNRSNDNSAQLAREAGSEVFHVSRQGKGAVVRYIFREIDADVYIMVDGDDTYPAEYVHQLMEPIVEGTADMVIGERFSLGKYQSENKRPFHNFGNDLVRTLVNQCFKSDVKDVMTGYRAFSRRFAKNVPILSDGFEVETEMTIRCLDRKLPLVAVPVSYRDRPEGSFSKLHTFRDGFRVIKTIFTILKEHRPLFFFGLIAFLSLLVAFACGIPVILEFFRTRYVSHVPLAILATGAVLVSITMLNCGLVLDTLIAHERQRNEINILSAGRKH